MQSTAIQAKVEEMFQTIIDPELGVDIWTMGLIYRVDIHSERKIEVVMTFTSPLCPAGEQLKEEVEESMRILGFTEVSVTVTFDPPWRPPAELRAALGV